MSDNIAVERWLTREEIERITARVKPAAQRRVLTQSRIPFILDADGRPVVLRQHITGKTDARQKAEPKWPQSAVG